MLTISIFSLLSTTFATGQPQTGERIGMAPLPGFVSGHRQEGQGNSIEEFVPRGETVQRWTRMVTVQRFGGIAARTTPLDYARSVVAGIPAACPGAVVDPPETLRIGDLPAARTWVRCPRLPATGLPESFFLVAIAGASDMHVIQVAFRRAPTDADLRFMAERFASVRLCASASREPVCAAR